MSVHIEFEGGGNYITARVADKVVIRCNTQYTDLRETEHLDRFIGRHGGSFGCAIYLRDCYREKVAA